MEQTEATPLIPVFQAKKKSLNFIPNFQYARSGDMRLLVVLSDESVPEFKNVPTAKEKGLDMSYGTGCGCFSRAH